MHIRMEHNRSKILSHHVYVLQVQQQQYVSCDEICSNTSIQIDAKYYTTNSVADDTNLQAAPSTFIYRFTAAVCQKWGWLILTKTSQARDKTRNKYS